MANPWEFLEKWARENVHPSGFEAEAVAKHLARECLRAAEQAHISTAAVIKASGGNLEAFMLSELESAQNREIDRLASKKTSIDAQRHIGFVAPVQRQYSTLVEPRGHSSFSANKIAVTSQEPPAIVSSNSLQQRI